MFSLISCCITFCLLLHTFCDSIQLRNFIRFQIVIVICDLLLLLQRPLPPSSSSSSSSSLSLLFSRLINIFIAFSRPLSLAPLLFLFSGSFTSSYNAFVFLFLLPCHFLHCESFPCGKERKRGGKLCGWGQKGKQSP